MGPDSPRHPHADTRTRKCRPTQVQLEFDRLGQWPGPGYGAGRLWQDEHLESMRLAMSAAETGHLVFATMNTTCASGTVYRLVDSFPVDEQSEIRSMLAESLRGVVSQHLIPKLDGGGLMPAFEVLIVNNAIANLIRKENTHLIGSAMVTGKAGGMVLLDDSLKELVNRKVISGQEAYYRAINTKNFEKYRQGESSA